MCLQREVSVFPLEYKRRRIFAPLPRRLNIYSLLTAITPIILDVLDLFFGRKTLVWALTETLILFFQWLCFL